MGRLALEDIDGGSTSIGRRQKVSLEQAEFWRLYSADIINGMGMKLKADFMMGTDLAKTLIYVGPHQK